jgi:hypothetical protein
MFSCLSLLKPSGFLHGSSRLHHELIAVRSVDKNEQNLLPEMDFLLSFDWGRTNQRIVLVPKPAP